MLIAIEWAEFCIYGIGYKKIQRLIIIAANSFHNSFLILHNEFFILDNFFPLLKSVLKAENIYVKISRNHQTTRHK